MKSRIKYYVKPWEYFLMNQPIQDSDTTVELQRAKRIYVEVISILKDSLEVAWKVAPVVLLPAGLMVWNYLRSIGWENLFYDSAMSGMGLVFLLLLAFLFFLSITLMFIVPSFIMIMTLPYYKISERLPRKIPHLYGLVFGFWILEMCIIIIKDWPYVGYGFLLLFMVAISFSFYNRSVLGLLSGSTSDWPKTTAAWRILVLSFCATLAIGFTTFPLVVCFRVSSEYAKNEQNIWFLLGGCVVASCVSLLPGFSYLLTRTEHVGIYRSIKGALLGTFLLVYTLFFAYLSLAPLPAMVFRFAGVYKNVESNYQVLNQTLIPAFAMAGLRLKKLGEGQMATGYLRYGFAGTKLVCRDKFDPASVSADAIRFARERHEPDPVIVAGSHCVPTSTGDLREVRE